MLRNFRFVGEKASLRPEVQKRSVELANQLPKYNGKAYAKVKNDVFATHLAVQQESGVELFPLYWDEYIYEPFYLRDSEFVKVSECKDGQLVVLEGGILWWNYVLDIWEQEWRKTPEYQEMIRASMEAIREDERGD